MAERARGYAQRIDVNVAPARVWRALTDTSCITRWCSPNSRVSPRAGGSVTASLDREREMEAHIDVFDPERRLRLIHLPSAAVPQGNSVTIDDIMIEWRDPMTVVRVLGSGFPDAPEHDQALRRHVLGWRQSLARLKVYLEKNLDEQEPST
jgi:uncharacterized protein YndB with AHSA1/START domain